MMRITTIAYGYTFNRGNYQSELIDLTATLDEGDDPIEAALRLKVQVLRLGGDIAGARDAQGDAEARRLAVSERAGGE